jgi:hypothetical protein
MGDRTMRLGVESFVFAVYAAKAPRKNIRI